MAVKIDIPGIGEVIAENAASEETLKKLVVAIEQAGKSSGSAAKVQQEQAKAVNDTTKALKNMTQGSKEFSVGWAAAGDAAVKSLKNLGVTATAVAAKFLTQYADIADNPIKAGRDLINTGIDIVADFAGGLSKAIPFIGEFVSGLSKAAAEIAKAANVVFADQLEKNIKALQDYAKSGVSFAGGMRQMQIAATNAGLGIKDFSNIVAKNKAELNKLGLAGGDAADRLSRSLGQLASKRPGGFPSIRDELLKLGYTYEDSGALLTSYMASMSVSGKLRNMSDKEVINGTRQYAKDLKVLADITGKDAMKAQEEAQKASLLADIQARLSPEELDKFQAAYRAMPDYAKKGFMEYVSSGGTAIADASTNIAMSQNKEFERLVKGTYATIKDANTDASGVQKQVLEQTAAAGKAQADYNKTQGAAIGMATRFTGGLQGATDIINGLTAESWRFR